MPGTNLVHVGVAATDLDRSLKVWRGVLGLKVMDEREGIVVLSDGAHNFTVFAFRSVLLRAVAAVFDTAMVAGGGRPSSGRSPSCRVRISSTSALPRPISIDRSSSGGTSSVSR